MDQFNGDDLDRLDFDAARARTDRELLLMIMMAQKTSRDDMRDLRASVKTCQGERQGCYSQLALGETNRARRQGAVDAAKYMVATLLSAAAVLGAIYGVIQATG